MHKDDVEIRTAAVVVYIAGAFVCVLLLQSEGYSEHLPGFNLLRPQVLSHPYSGMFSERQTWRMTHREPRILLYVCEQETCLNGIMELVGNWISQSSYHVVWLNCKAAYGYEYLFTHLGKKFNTEVQYHTLGLKHASDPKQFAHFCVLCLYSGPR